MVEREKSPLLLLFLSFWKSDSLWAVSIFFSCQNACCVNIASYVDVRGINILLFLGINNLSPSIFTSFIFLYIPSIASERNISHM